MHDLSVCIVSVLKTVDGNTTSVGMGFLLSNTQMMTCTHVIMSALGVKDATALEQASVSIELGVCTASKRVVNAQVLVVHPLSNTDGNHELEDICLLEFSENVDFSCSEGMFSVYKPQTKVQMFGFGEADLRQKDQGALNRGRWVDGQCKGPNRDWEQINTSEREILRGYSGGPVFNQNRSKILGMLVARDAGENIAHMIPASLLSKEVPAMLIEVAPIIQVLSRVLDRKEQSTVLQSASANSICHCFVMECTNGDAAELFAHKIKAIDHMQKSGLRNMTKEAIEPIHFAYSPSSGSFIEVLEEEIEENVVSWLKRENELKVVFVSSSDGRNIIRQIERIIADINTLNIELCDQASLAQCIIIVPFYRDQFSWLGATIAKFQMRNLKKRGLVELPKLGEVSSYHLSVFIPDLPKNARKDFESKFDTTDINQDFYRCMKENKTKKYREIKPEFEQILQNRTHQK